MCAHTARARFSGQGRQTGWRSAMPWGTAASMTEYESLAVLSFDFPPSLPFFLLYGPSHPRLLPLGILAQANTSLHHHHHHLTFIQHCEVLPSRTNCTGNTHRNRSQASESVFRARAQTPGQVTAVASRGRVLSSFTASFNCTTHTACV
jgi:hypothetical protein